MVCEARIELGELPFGYWETGASTAQAVVFLHALGAGADDWLDIAIDQRRHGGSARPDTYSFELMHVSSTTSAWSARF